MGLLAKKFYALAELQDAWEMPDTDVYYLAMAGDLKLTFMVHELRILARIPLKSVRLGIVEQTYSGILDLRRCDADRVLRRGTVEITEFEMPNEDKGRLASKESRITVRREDLLGRVDKRGSQTGHVLIQGCSLGSSHGPWGLVGCGMGSDQPAVAI